MDRTVDQIVTVYRVMLLVCVAVILLMRGEARDTLPSTHAMNRLDELRDGFVRPLNGFAAAEAGRYRPVFAAAAANSPYEGFVARSRFLGAILHAGWDRGGPPPPFPFVLPGGNTRPDPFAIDIALDGSALYVGQLLDLLVGPKTLTIAQYRLLPEDLRDRLPAIIDESGEDAATARGTFEIGYDANTSTCFVALAAYAVRDQTVVSDGFPIRCSPDAALDVSSLGTYFSSESNLPAVFGSDDTLRKHAYVPVNTEAQQLRGLAAVEMSQQSSDVDLLGLKVPKEFAQPVVPIMLALLMLQMLVHVRIAADLAHDPAVAGDGMSWFGQFNTWFRAALMLAPLVALPFFTYMPTLAGLHPTNSPHWIVWWVLEGGLPFAVSIAVWVQSVWVSHDLRAPSLPAPEILWPQSGAEVAAHLFVAGTAASVADRVALYVRAPGDEWQRGPDVVNRGRLWEAALVLPDGSAGARFELLAIGRAAQAGEAPAFAPAFRTPPADCGMSAVTLVTRGASA